VQTAKESKANYKRKMAIKLLMSITKAPKEAFDFAVRHPQLEYIPGQEPVGRKKYTLHKNIESKNFSLGRDSTDRYINRDRSSALLHASPLPRLNTERRDYNAHTSQPEADEIQRLKAQLRQKELMLMKLTESFEVRSPPKPEPRRPPPLKAASQFSPEKLYEMSIQESRGGVNDSFQANRSYSVEPPRGSKLRDEIKPYASHAGPVADLLKHPAFHQPRFTRSNPKASVGNPITGLASRSKTPERMAHYGNMMFNRPL
jgi:hypothetical protein